MKRSLCVAFVCLALSGQAHKKSDLADMLNFEAGPNGALPRGWGGGPPGTLFADDSVVHSGKWSARIERTATSEGTFSTMTKFLPMDFAGKTVMLRGFLRLEQVNDFAGLWMREDGESGAVAFDNMQQRHLTGTHDWDEYSIELPIKPEARQLYFGFLLAGTGKVWADDLQLLVDGKPVWDAPKVDRPTTPLDLDHEFDKGSGIALSNLSRNQVDNLVTLGKVWGFLKYHHPSVTSGKFQWDYELFRVLPAVAAATDRAAANAAMLHWVEGLGTLGDCVSCAKPEKRELQFPADVNWIRDETLLGPDLSRRLQSIYKNRASGKQFFVSLVAGVGNPSFDHELPYAAVKFPDSGFQLLAAYRFWNIIEYWSPYRNVLGENWDGVLAEFIPKVGSSTTFNDYQLQLMALIARAHDTHANLWTSLAARPPVGECQLPLTMRFLENRAVVTGYAEDAADQAGEVKPGDVIDALDGEPMNDLVNRWKPYYGASNEPAKLRDIARDMTRGACGPTSVRVIRNGTTLNLQVTRMAIAPAKRGGGTHDLPGLTFRLLSDKVAYLKLSTVKEADVSSYIQGATGTTGLIIDIRNYPSAFVVFALGSTLVDKETPFVRFTSADLSEPGAFVWSEVVTIKPQKLHYPGKVVILVDEVTLSSAEYTTMALRSSPRAIVVGSTTAGADGNVSAIPLPGGLRTVISGIGVFYPDTRPTQRVGIVPDVEVRPTVAGIRAGRDEVLEEAIRRIVPEMPAAEIEKMARR